MADYNPEAFDEAADDAAEQIEGLTGEVIEITQDTAGTFFGENTQGDPNDEMLEVQTELPSGDVITDYFSLPNEENPELSWANPQFRLARYREQYGEAPRVGHEVTIAPNARGFLSIELADVDGDD